MKHRVILAGIAAVGCTVAVAKDLQWSGKYGNDWDWRTANWTDSSTGEESIFDWGYSVTVDTSKFQNDRYLVNFAGSQLVAGDIVYDVGAGITLTNTTGKNTFYLTGATAFVKKGAGELLFYAKDNSGMQFIKFNSAPIDITEGRVTLTGAGSDDAYSGGADNPTQWIVRKGASLRVASRSAIGLYNARSGFKLKVQDGGAFQIGPDLFNAANHCLGSYRELWLDGGTLSIECPGANEIAVLGVQDLLKVTGSKACVLSNGGDASRTLGFGYGVVPHLNPRCVIDVEDVTSDVEPDLDIAMQIGRNNGWATNLLGFVKTGEGTLRFSAKGSDKRGINGDVDILGGTVQFSGEKSFSQALENRVYVSTNAALHLAHPTATHYGQTLDGHARTRFHIDHGSFVFDAAPSGGEDTGYCYLGKEIVFENATFSAPMNGQSDDVDRIGLLFAGDLIHVKGTAPFSFVPAKASAVRQRMSLGDPATEFRIENVSGDDGVDMTCGYRLDDWYWNDGRKVRRSKLVKTGAGTLLLKDITGRFSGGVEIREGTIRLDGSVSGTAENEYSFLGCNTNSDVEVLVSPGATLEFMNRSQFMYYTMGEDGNNRVSRPLHVNGGTVKMTATEANGGSVNQAFGPVTVENGATFEYTVTAANGPFSFHDTFAVRGNTPFTLPAVTSGGNIMWLYPGYRCVFDVEDVTEDLDPDFITYLAPTQPSNPDYYDGSTPARGPWSYGFIKRGVGTMALMHADPKWCHTLPVKVEAGTLLVNDDFGRSQGFEVSAGAFIGGTGKVRSVTLADGAGLMVSNGQPAPLESDGAVTFPATGTVVIKVATEDELRHIRVPVLKSLAGSYVGAENLANWRVSIPGFEKFESCFRLRLGADGLKVSGGTEGAVLIIR